MLRLITPAAPHKDNKRLAAGVPCFTSCGALCIWLGPWTPSAANNCFQDRLRVRRSNTVSNSTKSISVAPCRNTCTAAWCTGFTRWMASRTSLPSVASLLCEAPFRTTTASTSPVPWRPIAKRWPRSANLNMLVHFSCTQQTRQIYALARQLHTSATPEHDNDQRGP